MSGQESLFDLGPQLDPEQSQWFTPRWVADRMAAWVRCGTVVEPSAGGGALIEALLRAGQPSYGISAVELDPRWIEVLRSKFPGVAVTHGDFLDPKLAQGSSWSTCLMNPPYEDDKHTAFILRALELCDVVIALVPSSTEYSAGRDRDLWASKAMVTRRARLPNRVKFGGDNQASFDSVCLRIVRRNAPRKPGERLAVEEEVWLP